MRHFLVLGFATTSKKEAGKSLYLGSDRSSALEEVNTPSDKFMRKELFELAVPQIRRHKVAAVSDEPSKEPAKAKLIGGAKKFIEEKGLTDEQVTKIVGTGKSGSITQKDVETYLASKAE